MISKVHIIGDSYRGDQARNIEQLYRLLRHVFSANGVKCDARISKQNKIVDLENWQENWARSLNPGFPSELKRLRLADTAIVAFEMSPVDRMYLDSVGVPWMNFEIHPIRFLDDLYFNVESSCRINLSAAEIPDDYIDIQAEVLRSKYRNEHVQEEGEKKLLIVGQTPIDKSIFFDGEFKNLTSYLDALDGLAGKFDSIEYKPHPYLTDAEVDEIICSRYSAKKCEENNIYKLFCDGNLSGVAAISSSVLHEAPYFGIDAFTLEPRTKTFGRPASYAKLIQDAHLWVGPLLGKSLKRRACDLTLPIPKNYLRDVYCHWAYESDKQVFSSRISALESEQAEKEKQLGQIQETLDTVNQKQKELKAMAEGLAQQTVQQAEARAQQAEGLAQQAEARARQAESSAQQAEARARQAESSAQQAEARAQQAESSAQQAEARAQQAESRAQEIEAQMRQMERSVQQAEDLEKQRVSEAESGRREAEARAQQSESRAQEAELRAQQVGDMARQLMQEVKQSRSQAEVRAQQAENHAREAEQREQQAQTRIQEAALRVQQAEARAWETEQRMQQAEARAQEAEHRTQQAEAYVRETESRAQQTENQMQQMQRDTEQWRLWTEDAHAQIAAIHSSTSWRITRPLRGLKRMLMGDFRPARQVASGTILRTKIILRPVLAASIRCVFNRPALRSALSRLLKKWPWLHRRLMRVAANTEAVPELAIRAKDESAFTENAAPANSMSEERSEPVISSVDGEDKKELEQNLTPHARRIYKDLKAAIAQQQGRVDKSPPL